MKDKVKELLAHIKGVKPSYFIQYTVEDGEIVILEARKTFPVDGKEHPNMIWGDAMAELQPEREVIARYEKDGVNEEKAALWREYWEKETDKKQSESLNQ